MSGSIRKSTHNLLTKCNDLRQFVRLLRRMMGVHRLPLELLLRLADFQYRNRVKRRLVIQFLCLQHGVFW